MPITIAQPPVYWIEADEEAGLLIPDKNGTMARRSLLAYILLRRVIVAHPADLWQSTLSNSLVFEAQAQAILKSTLKLHLGDSPNVTQYMSDRITKLENDEASVRTNVELQQYSKYGNLLQSQSAELDELFIRSGATFPAQGSRDMRFRQLLRQDLRNNTPFGPHLAACIRHGLNRMNADRVIKTLEELTYHRKRFISIDGITSRISEAGCSPGVLNRIHCRLQLLHWESRSEGRIEMPLLARAKNGTLEPSDPNVFWSGVDGLIGSELQSAVMILPWPTALGMANELRNDATWGKFIDTYQGIVNAVERNHEQLSESIVRSEVLRKYPRFWRVAMTTRPDKWTILSWVCHIGSWCLGIPDGWALVVRGGSAVATSAKMIGHITKIVNAYYSTDRHVIVSRIKNMIAETTKVK